MSKPTRPLLWRSPVAIAALLFLVALAWRLPFSLQIPALQKDEAVFSVPTIERILQGEFPLYAHHAAYMAPVHEYFTAAFFARLGASLWAFRLPAITFGCLAIALGYLNVRRVLGAGPALAIGVLLAATHSCITYYTLFSFPTWGFGLLLVAILQAVTLWADRRRTVASWVICGLIVGFATYVFKITVLQSLCSVGWLAFRSGSCQAALRQIREDPAVARKARRFLLVAGLALVAWLPVYYRYFTRRDSYVATPLDFAMLAVALLLSAVAAGAAWQTCRLPASAWRKGVLLGLAAALTYLAPTQWYARVEQPRLQSLGVTFHDSSQYNLRQAHAWPFQVQLLLERVIPPYLIGRIATVSVEGDMTTPENQKSFHTGWPTILSLSFFAILAGGGIVLWKRGERLDLADPHWIFVGPLLLSLVLMVPSWSLHNDWCFRYFVPFHAGFLVLTAKLTEPWWTRWPRLAAAAVGAFAIYCAFDTFNRESWGWLNPPAAPGLPPFHGARSTDAAIGKSTDSRSEPAP